MSTIFLIYFNKKTVVFTAIYQVFFILDKKITGVPIHF